MDRSNTPPRRGSIIWRKLTDLTRRLYRAVGACHLGRWLTAYRRADAMLHHGRRQTLRDDCRPMSPARLRVLEAVREGKLLRGIGGLFSLLADAPASFYGLFLLFYSILNVLVYFAGPMVFSFLSFEVSRLFLCGVLFAIGLPLLFSGQPISQLLLTGRLTRWFFSGLLGLPNEQPRSAETKGRRTFRLLSPYLAFLLALGCAVAAAWIHPLLIPGIFLGVSLAGMILAVPESGVVLSTVTLPLLFWNVDAVVVTAAIVTVTWAAYGIKLLFMHRTFRLNLIDVAVLLFAASLGLAGMTGGYVTSRSVWTGLLYFVLYSLYLLITNLMTERSQLRRCLVGPLLSLVAVLIMTGVTFLPEHLWQWLEGSHGGNLLKSGLEGALAFFADAASPAYVCLLVIAIPCLFGLLLQRKKRLRHYAMTGALLLLSFGCLYLLHAASAMLTALGCLLLFLLLYSHRTLAAGILTVPWLTCGAVWASTYFAPQIKALATRWAEGQAVRESLWQGAWRTVCEHPAGIGLGDLAFSSVYPMYAEIGYAGVTEIPSLYLTIMLDMGIPGLLVFLFMAFLLIQKTLTCLKVCESTNDTVRILGGLTAWIGLLIYGLVSNTLANPAVMMTVIVVLSVCNAFQNVVFDRWDMVVAGMSRENNSTDCMVHAP